jgi:predicted ATPase
MTGPLTPDRRLRVFISSTLNELAPERAAARAAVESLHLSPICFEAGARPYPAQALYRAYLAQSDIFVGIYWQSYGVIVPELEISGLEDEYRSSRGKPQLIYVKQPAAGREPPLQRMLDQIRAENLATYKKFATADDLAFQLAEDLAQLLTDQFARSHDEELASQRITTSLPRPRTAMIDRVAELDHARALLQRDDVNLVTLTGTGGVGKTRLGIEIAHVLAPTFEHGAAFVSLAPIRDPDLVPGEIAHALRVQADLGRSLLETLVMVLSHRQILLVIDNVEQLISAVASHVADLLQQSPRLKVLLTSREPVRIRGEWVMEVLPFEPPDASCRRSLVALSRVPSVALFAQRASEANPRFVLSEANRDDVTEICERLDGLPLAIELAAAHLQVLTPKLLAQRLEHRLSTLTRGPRDLPDRQRNLRDMLAWSYDLLDPAEQRLFRRIGVFRGSFGLDAAIAVDQPTDGDTLERIESLVSKNLLRVEPEADGAPRFWMLATIVEFARERLEAEGELSQVEHRHLDHYVNLAVAAEAHLLQGDREVWLDQLGAEDVNLRTLCEWCDASPETYEAGLRLAGTLTFYWLQSGYVREGLTALETALRRTSAADRGYLRAKALHGAAILSWKEAENQNAARYAEESLSIFRECGDLVWTGQSEWVLGVCRMALGRLDESRLLLDDALAVFRRAHHTWGEAMALGFLGINCEIRGDHEQALAFCAKTIELLVGIHDVMYEAIARGIDAGMRAAHGDRDAPGRYYEELHRLTEHAPNRWAIGRSLQSAAFNLQYNYSLHASAKVLYQGSLLLWQDVQRIELGFSVVRALAGIAEIAAAQHDAQHAGRLLGAADRLAPPTGKYREAFGERVARTLSALAADEIAAFDAAWREGQTATLEQTSEVALQA